MEKKIKPKYDASYRRGYRDGIIDGREVSTKALEDYLKLQPTTLVLSADESLQDKIKHLKSLLVRAGDGLGKAKSHVEGAHEAYLEECERQGVEEVQGSPLAEASQEEQYYSDLITEIEKEC